MKPSLEAITEPLTQDVGFRQAHLPVTPPRHLTAPSVLGWHTWRDAVLRTAGFPFGLLDAFSDVALAHAADALTETRVRRADAEQQVGASWRNALAAASSIEDPVVRQTALKALRQAEKTWKRRGEDAPAAAEVHLPREVVATALQSEADEAVASRIYTEAMAQAEQRSRAEIAALAADPLLRMAVSWQNHAAVGMALDPLAADADMPGSKRRQREALVANYAQRYAAKNDTIGFFGPVAWIRIVQAGPGRYVHGPEMVRSRRVQFEDWCIGSVSQQLADDDRYLPYLVPRMNPSVRQVRDGLLMPSGRVRALGMDQALVLSACDGVRTVREICGVLLANPFSPIAGPGAVHAMLRSIEREGHLRLAFQVPSCVDGQEVHLRAQLDLIDDAALRTEALARIGQLEALRADAGAATSSAELVERLSRLDAAFQGMTGQASRRRSGAVYGGRALTYEDCHRDLTLDLPEAALAPAMESLELINTSARWFTYEASRRFTAAFDRVFNTLVQRDRRMAVPLPEFWAHTQSIVFGDQSPLNGLAQELRRRWSTILSSRSADGSRIDIAIEDIRSQVAASFPAPHAGWNMARYQCPDVMFCAPSAQALCEGDYTAVLGEVHMGGHTLATNLFVSQHPHADSFLQALAADFGTRYVIPKLSPEASGTPIRTQWIDDPQRATEVLFSHGLVPANPRTAIPIADLDVLRDGDRLLVRRATDGWQMPLLDVLGDFLFLAVINAFGIVEKSGHVPRITIGRLVAQRECWSVPLAELAFLEGLDDAEAFVALRAWVGRCKLPRLVFVKVPWEAKPFYMDFSSLLYVRILVKQLVRGRADPACTSACVGFSEMLPAAQDLWLRDGQGRSYTCELRLACIHEHDHGR